MISKLLLLAVLTLFSTTSVACSCAYPRVDDAFNNSDLVFKGKVVKLESFSSSVFNKAIFDVHDSYKGKEKDFEIVFTNRSSAACGYHLRQGEEYLVFTFIGSIDQEEIGFALEGKQMITVCSLTMPLNSASPYIGKRREEVLEFLNAVKSD